MANTVEEIENNQRILLKNFIQTDGILSCLRQSYNGFIDRIPSIIASRKIYHSNGTTTTFSKVRFLSPTMKDVNGEDRPLYPRIARNQRYTYSGQITVDIVNAKYENGEIVEGTMTKRENVPIARVPIMLGSKVDYLADKTPLELFDAKECYIDPFCYYIVKGNERITNLQDNLRYNLFYLYRNKQDRILCQMTVPTLEGPKIVYVTFEKSTERTFAFRVGSSAFGNRTFQDSSRDTTQIQARTLPVLSVIRFLTGGQTSYENIISFISRFTREEWRKSVSNILRNSLIESNRLSSDAATLYEYLEIPKALDKTTQSEILTKLLTGIFPNIPSTNTLQKVYGLMAMTAYLAEYVQGKRGLDDRDSLSIKRLGTSGIKVEQLLTSCINIQMDKIQEHASENGLKGAHDVANLLSRLIINDDFETSFNTSNWGPSGSRKKENIAEAYQSSMNVLMRLRNQTKVMPSMSKRSKSDNPRQIHASSYGYLDPSDTPEGEAVGLTRHLTVSCYLSQDRDEQIILDYVLNAKDLNGVSLFSSTPNPSFQTTMVLNGKIIGWCIPEAMWKFCLEKRRSGALYRDVAIIPEFSHMELSMTARNYLWIYSDTSRPVRPLLIVDPISQKPILDIMIEKAKSDPSFEPRLSYNSSIMELLSNGCLEYIDAWEQEFILLAETQTFLLKHRENLESFRKSIEFHQRLLKNIEVNSFSKSDIYELLGVEPSRTMNIKELQEFAYKLYKDNKTTEYNFNLVSNLNTESIKQELDSARKTLAISSKKIYTHTEISPLAILGYASGAVPLPDHIPGPRVTYTDSMQTQAAGIPSTVYGATFPTTMKLQMCPSGALFETQMGEIVGYKDLPHGQTIRLMIGSYYGFNQEDAAIFNQASIDRGLFTLIVRHTMESVAEKGGDFVEKFVKPQARNDEDVQRYHAIGDNGFPLKGAYVHHGDCIIGKIREITVTKGAAKEIENASEYVPFGQEGIVENVFVSRNSKNQPIVIVTIREIRKPKPGDKFAIRYAQKQTLGIILPDADMPYTEDGRRVDVIINPHAIPSRMTVALLMEMIATQGAAFAGESVDASGFQESFSLEKFQRKLRERGFREDGTAIVYNGMTGRRMEGYITVGPIYYMPLRHMVDDKISSRAIGMQNRLNRQPVKGRARLGAIRFGEMEKDTLTSHGASRLLMERLMYVSDAYTTVVCMTCGSIASSSINGPKCQVCKDKGQFGKITVPYSMMLMAKQMAGAGIYMSYKFVHANKEPKVATQASNVDIVKQNEGIDEDLTSGKGAMGIGVGDSAPDYPGMPVNYNK